MFSEQDIQLAGWFMMRTPAYAFDKWRHWTDECRMVNLHDNEESCTAKARRDTGRTALAALVCEPFFWEALYVASESLLAVVPYWLAHPNTSRGKSIEAKLVAFFTRMCSRPTPFGLFAGITHGTVGPRTCFTLANHLSYERHIRLDLRLLRHIAAEAKAAPISRDALLWQPNPSLHRDVDDLRYYEYKCINPAESIYGYSLVSIQYTPYIEQILHAATPGAAKPELVDLLVSQGESTAVCTQFIDDLIDNQVLVSDLGPGITGESLAAMNNKLRQVPGLASMADMLDKTSCTLSKLQREPAPFIQPEVYETAIHAVKSRLMIQGDQQIPCLHVDLAKPALCAELNRNVVRELSSALRALHSLSPHRNGDWVRFKRDFVGRFGDRSVPLLMALDEESGVPFGAPPSPSDSDLNNQPLSSKTDQVAWGSQHSQLLSLVWGLKEGSELRLSDSHISELSKSDKNRPLPDYMTALVSILSASGKQVDDGEFRIVIHSFAPFASAIARFTAIDSQLREGYLQIVERERTSHPDWIWAEIVHYPAGPPMGNVLERPLLRTTEIPCLGISGTADHDRIHLRDITVSVEDDHVILRSVRSGVRIMPSLNNAHKFWDAINLPLYRFLANLPLQPFTDFPRWDWGPVLNGLPFLPRVSYRRAIFALARWLVTRDEFAGLRDEHDQAWLRKLEVWRVERRIPRFASLEDFDQKLLIDFENPFSVRALWRQVSKRTTFTLTEAPSVERDLFIESVDGGDLSTRTGHSSRQRCVICAYAI
jgi:lantibiotic biosynthesis protein